MFVVRKTDAEFRNELAPFLRRIVNVAEAGKQITTGIAGTDRDVTVRAYRRRRSLARKELLAVAIQTGRVLGKITDIGKGRISFAHFLPILCRNFVT